MTSELISEMRHKIDRGLIDEVVLVGPATCTGWRLLVDRVVDFVHRTPIHDDDQIEQNQAKYRIVEAEKWPPRD